MKTTASSIWAAAAICQLAADQSEGLYAHTAANINFEVKAAGDSLWITTDYDKVKHFAFRAAYSPDGFQDIQINRSKESALQLSLKSATGTYSIHIEWPVSEQTVLHYTTTFTPMEDLGIPFWPRDILAYDQHSQGEVHIKQEGTRSGLLYASFQGKHEGAFLYFQNLSALKDYNEDTQTSAGGIVGGNWPEMGMLLPPTQNACLQAGKAYTISDAFVAFSRQRPKDQFGIAKGFIEALGNLYVLLPQPETKYHDYLEALPKALHDLETNKGCWSHRSGHPYLNAYLCDYDTPPEVMVQLAVLLPVEEYMRWSGKKCHVTQDIIGGLAAFYDEKLKTIMRWLPAEEKKLDRSEEQKKPKVMDAWYLHHPLLNLARLAGFGNKLAKELLLNSVDYAIKVAHHFNYVWPVFYQMETLEIIKAETQPGQGGEKDVAGLYAHVMLQVWELTKDQKYFSEAEKAAHSMVQHGFDVLYQSNNTMFAAKAMILLYRETKKELYRDLSYLFLANILKNVALWECGYGNGKYFPTFFELFPLSDAPYTAVYEEQETFAGVQEFLSYAQGMELLPAVPLLLSEFIRHGVHRMLYYYPPMLPEEMLVKEVKTGELDPKLWIALEDIHDGWEPSGKVGQEVYGAGLTFGIVPRQYTRIPDEEFLVFCDYPVLNQRCRDQKLTMDVQGDPRLICRLMIVTKGKKPLPSITVKTGELVKKQKYLLEYRIKGGQQIQINW